MEKAWCSRGGGVIMLRLASDSDIKKAISNMQGWLEEAKKEGNQFRIQTLEETIKNSKEMLQIRNN